MKPFNEKDTQKFGDGNYGFHGDVIIEKIDEIPIEFSLMPEVKDDCVAYGEHTGHAHKLFGDFELREHPKTKDKYFVANDVIYLKHQEHRPVEIQPGNYKVGIQREYDHFSEMIREVQD